ncbi:hypothetical protein [Streptomyces sp. NPDC058678]|uniref:hypothetical protein n=1 Tax=Streptomyces sp. NPDC058678 TaxID=3346595 RepID=UPI00365DB7CB
MITDVTTPKAAVHDTKALPGILANLDQCLFLILVGAFRERAKICRQARARWRESGVMVSVIDPALLELTARRPDLAASW